MKTMKRILSILLALMLFLSITPLSALAAAPSYIYVGGISLSSGQYLASGSSSPTTSKPSGSYAYYKDGELTLKNYTYTGTGASYSGPSCDGIYAGGDLKLTLLGKSTIDMKNKATSFAVHVDGTLSISEGETGAALTLRNCTEGIDASSSVVIASGTLNITSDEYCIYTESLFSITGGSVTAVGESDDAICADGAALIVGGYMDVSGYTQAFNVGSFVKTGGTVMIHDSHYGISTGGSVTVNGGALDISATAQAIWASGDIEFTNLLNGTAILRSEDENALFTRNGSFILDGVDAYGGDDANDVSKCTASEIGDYAYVEVGPIVTVGGVKLQNGAYLATGSTTPVYTEPKNGYAYYKNGTLTLNNYTYSGEGCSVPKYTSYTALVCSEKALTVKLVGTNTLTNSINSKGVGIWVLNEALTIIDGGSGALNITVKDDGIYAYTNLTISGGTINVDSGDDGIFANANLTISGSTITVTTDGYGIYTYANLTISGGTLNITCEDEAVHAKSISLDGVRAYGKDTYEGTWVEVADTGAYKYFYAGVDEPPVHKVVYVNDVVLKDGEYLAEDSKTVTTTKLSDNYAYYEDGVLTLKNFDLDATADYVIASDYDLTIRLIGSNTIAAENGNYGIYMSQGSLSITAESDDASLSLYGYKKGIAIHGGVLSIGSGNVYLQDVNVGIECLYDLWTASTMAMHGGTLTIVATDYAIRSNVLLLGGVMDITSENIGIESLDLFGMSGGALTLVAENVGILAGTINFTGGTADLYCPFGAALSGSTINIGEKVEAYGRNSDEDEWETLEAPYDCHGVQILPESTITVGDVGLAKGQYLSNSGIVSASKPSGGYAYFTGTTLTLHDFEITNYPTVGIDYPTGNLTLVLEGENTIHATGDAIRVFGGSLTIREGAEGGSLTVEAGGYVAYVLKSVDIYGGTITSECATLGILSYNSNITIHGGNIHLSVDNAPLYAAQNIYLYGDTINLTSAAGLQAVYAAGSVYFNGGDITITAESSIGLSAGGKVAIQDGTVTIYGHEEGIHCLGSLEVNGGVLRVDSYDSVGIRADGQSVTMNGGTLTVTSEEDGIVCNHVTVDTGKLNVYSYSGTALVIDGGLNVIDGTVTLNAAENGVVATADIYIVDSTLVVRADGEYGVKTTSKFKVDGEVIGGSYVDIVADGWALTVETLHINGGNTVLQSTNTAQDSSYGAFRNTGGKQPTCHSTLSRIFATELGKASTNLFPSSANEAKYDYILLGTMIPALDFHLGGYLAGNRLADLSVTGGDTFGDYSAMLLPADGKLVEGYAYQLEIYITAKEGISFANTPMENITLDGMAPTKVTVGDSNTYIYTYQLPACPSTTCNTVGIEGLILPAPGATPDFSAALSNPYATQFANYGEGGCGYYWYDSEGAPMSSTDTFKKGETYSIEVKLEPNTANGVTAFQTPVTATVNGNAAEVMVSSKAVYITATFTCNAFETTLRGFEVGANIYDVNYTGAISSPLPIDWPGKAQVSWHTEKPNDEDDYRPANSILQKGATYWVTIRVPFKDYKLPESAVPRQLTVHFENADGPQEKIATLYDYRNGSGQAYYRVYVGAPAIPRTSDVQVDSFVIGANTDSLGTLPAQITAADTSGATGARVVVREREHYPEDAFVGTLEKGEGYYLKVQMLYPAGTTEEDVVKRLSMRVKTAWGTKTWLFKDGTFVDGDTPMVEFVGEDIVYPAYLAGEETVDIFVDRFESGMLTDENGCIPSEYLPNPFSVYDPSVYVYDGDPGNGGNLLTNTMLEPGVSYWVRVECYANSGYPMADNVTLHVTTAAGEQALKIPCYSAAGSSTTTYGYIEVGAPAGASIPVYVGGVALYDGDYLAVGATESQTTKPAGGYAYYKDGTLTLHDYSYEGKGALCKTVAGFEGDSYYYATVYGAIPYDVVLEGNNTLTQIQNYDYVIYGNQDVTISGSGSLTLTSTDGAAYGLEAANVTINGGNLLFKRITVALISPTTINGGTIKTEGITTFVNRDDLTVNGGTFDVRAQYVSYYANVVFNGGSGVFRSTKDAALYQSNVTVAEGVKLQGTTTLDGAPETYDPEKSEQYIGIVLGNATWTTDPSVYVGGVGMQDGDYLAVGATTTQRTKPSGGYAYYSGGTLTLNNYTYEGEGYDNFGSRLYRALIFSRTDLKLVLVGTNTLTETYWGYGYGPDTSYADSYGIDMMGANLTISGDTLVLDGVFRGIGSYNGAALDCTIESGNISISNSHKWVDYGIRAHNLYVKNATIRSGATLYATQDITIEKGNFPGSDTLYGNNVTIYGGTFTFDHYLRSAIIGEASVTINGGTITIDSQNNASIKTPQLTINGGSISLKSSNCALKADNLTISSALKVQASTEYDGTLGDFDPTDWTQYEYVVVGTVSTSKPGDLNGDGNINNRDLALLQQYINKWDVTIDLDAADVNDDGNINNRDLALLQQYINKWDVVLK